MEGYYGTNNKLMTAMQEIATQDTAQYFYTQFNQPEFIPTDEIETFEELDYSKHKLRELCFDHATLDGFVAEYGVDQGKSFKQLCRQYEEQPVYGFDAFKGLPEGGRWPGNIVHKGKFDYKGLITFEVPLNGIITAGWFNETLPEFDYTDRTAKFLHIDCDVYSSTVTILDSLLDYIDTGTVIVFDDYCNHTNWRHGEWLAWKEFCYNHQVDYKYLYCAGMSVGLIVK